MMYLDNGSQKVNPHAYSLSPPRTPALASSPVSFAGTCFVHSAHYTPAIMLLLLPLSHLKGFRSSADWRAFRFAFAAARSTDQRTRRYLSEMKYCSNLFDV